MPAVIEKQPSPGDRCWCNHIRHVHHDRTGLDMFGVPTKVTACTEWGCKCKQFTEALP